MAARRKKAPDPSQPPILGPFDSAGFHLWHVTTQWRSAVSAALAPLDLTHIQFFVLGAVNWLSRTEPPNQREVSELALLDVMTTSQALRNLGGRGLLERRDDPHDSRSWRIHITPAGERLVSQAAASVRAVDAAFFGRLGGARDRFVAELRRFSAAEQADDERSRKA